MKRAQIQSQVFVYILALLIMSFILIYGYNSLTRIRETGDLALTINFKSDIKRAISSISSDYGSIKVEEISVPTGYREVCFVNLSNNAVPDDYGIIQNYVEDVITNNAEPRNVFLYPEGIESVYVGEIEVEDDFLCVDVSYGKIKIKLEGLGNRAKVYALN